MHSFKAILVKPVSFQTFEGRARTIKAGVSIEVIQLKTPLVSTCARGRRSVEVSGSFVGMLGPDSFDIEQDEFKTVD